MVPPDAYFDHDQPDNRDFANKQSNQSDCYSRISGWIAGKPAGENHRTGYQ